MFLKYTALQFEECLNARHSFTRIYLNDFMFAKHENDYFRE
jgi:hypothetical protein